MTGPLDTLYREVVLEHHRHPRGNRPLADPDIEASGQNPSCGDDVVLQMRFEGDRIAAVGVLTRGCAISTSSGSMMAELIEGRTVSEAAALAERFREVMQGKTFPAEVDLGDLSVLEGVKQFPVRIKCALLPWLTLLDAILARRQGRPPQPLDTEGLPAGGPPMQVDLKERS
ncbi:MAG: SUF system NifU family Fe-S cluster assembly protein [Candidatus Krumholzibacteria bacterium]|jgi:nitrogen fixation NifU-like protein|nr:SUF system NifU family Fe-S cluster assembly protein [Candidatus Krumholzibacteria bacterium]